MITTRPITMNVLQKLYQVILPAALLFSLVLSGSITAGAQCSFTNYTLSPNGYICTNTTTVTLSGSQTGVTYQLQGNGAGNIGAALSGTGSAISWANVPVTTGGTYLVLASRSGCSATTAGNTTIYYSPAPNGTLSQSGAYIWDNNTITLTVTPSAPGNYTYTWFRNSQYVAAGSSATYTATAAGSYFVLMNSSCGSKQLTFQNIVSLPYTAGDCSQLNSAPTATTNYVITDVIRQPGISSGTTDAQIAAIGTCDVSQAIQYIDGLGRPAQTVQVKGSPLGNDIIEPIAYDPYGREAVKYLPYVAPGSNNGAYRSSAISEQAVYYHPANTVSGSQQPGINIINTASPYAITNYEPSPLNRPVEQGAPGDAWQPVAGSTSGHTVKTVYGTNAAGEVTLWAVNSGGGATGNSSYAPGTLYKTTTTDENGNSAIAYKDKQNQVVCKMVQNGTANLATYYVYDNFNNLTYVVPPVPSASNPQQTAYPASFAETDAVFLNYIYGYHYDGRNRLIQKKVPGKGWEYTVYNTLDQVVAVQDANQRGNNQWTFSKYDAQGRVVMTGIWAGAVSQGSLQSTVNGQATLWESPAAGGNGYTNAAWPASGVSVTLTINYYDGYSFSGQPAAFTGPAGYSASPRGLLTASQANVLGTTNMLWKVNYYDGLGRVVQAYAQHYLGGVMSPYNYDVISNTYDFTNNLTSATRQQYIKNAGNTAAALSVTVANTYVFDHEGRKHQTLEQINGGANVLLSDEEYNEIGQLAAKNLHSTNNGSSYLQSTAYAYNERGWLLSNTAPLFEEQLQYNTNAIAGMAAPVLQYNGNISSLAWGTGSSANTIKETFNYDALNRLTAGNCNTGNSENAIGYDVLGNILALTRYQAGNVIDQLNYAYNSTNQLQSVADGSGNNAGLVSGTTGYSYDVNGNELSQANATNTQNKNITYNMLNLPQVYTLPSGTVTYTYDAEGNKLRKVSVISGNTATEDYISGIQYTTGGAIDFIQTEEGRALNSGGNYHYEYSLTDHLGNERVTFDTYTGTAVQVQADDYYPFGLEINNGVTSPKNLYLYNKKELQQELGQYDYGARIYDPVIGRMTTIDPLAENHHDLNPYNYVMNNPILYDDIFGLDTGKVHQLQEVKVVATQTKKSISTILDFNFWRRAPHLSPVTHWYQKALAYINGGRDYNGVHYDNQGNPTGISLNKLEFPFFITGPGDLEDLVFTIIDQEGETVIYSTKLGSETITFGGDITKTDDVLTIKNFDIDGKLTNQLGRKGLDKIIQQFGKQQGVKEIIIEGAKRTTGANPGRLPTALKFIIR